MKSIGSAVMAAAFALVCADTALASQSSFGNRWGGFARQVQDDCDDLRVACLNKDAMDERGQGNCQRYREKCGVNPDYCARLLEACIHKNAQAKGKRSCRHYRLECGQA
jgi:hypothetical protein